MTTPRPVIAILGAGSWGTAVAIHLAAAGHEVLLWSHNTKHVTDMLKQNMNQRYLPDDVFPKSLKPCGDLKQCLKLAGRVILAVPSHAFRDLLHQIDKPESGLAWLTKGLDPDSHSLLSLLVSEKWGTNYPVAVISGPSFAKEVAKGLPTALTVAGNDADFQTEIQKCLHHNNMRVYLSNDLAGVQLAGAVKNVLAIACGVSDGLGFGANAKAALITRGLSEMRRLGLALGASEKTFAGLAGVGDLVLTCTDNQSRNRRFGLYLGQGMDIKTAENQIGQVVEGKFNARQILTLAVSYQIEMPICEQVSALLENTTSPLKAVGELMRRSVGDEFF